jgi:tetratricopeptide (TPR) repeat protein
VLLFVKVQRADVRRTPLYSVLPAGKDEYGNPVQIKTYISRTQVEFNASIQAVDLATGKIFNQIRIAAAPERQNASPLGQPEFPSDTEVLELATAKATEKVHRMLLPWTEQRKLIFYDDKDYGMKEAYRRLQLNDAPGALRKSLEALAAAKADKAKDKYLGRTNYNVGMCYFIQGDYPSALPYLQAARETNPKHRIFEGAETECLRAKRLAEEMTRVDARSAKVELDPGSASTPAGSALAGSALAGSAPAGSALAGSAAPRPAAGTAEERLVKLEALLKKGLISPEDYKAKKAQILSEL